jgi:hypothetical protein
MLLRRCKSSGGSCLAVDMSNRKANNLEASDIGSPFHYEKITAMLR